MRAVLAAVWRRVEACADHDDSAAVLSDQALADGQALVSAAAASADGFTLEITRALGWLHFCRYVVLPEGEDAGDLGIAIGMFAPLADQHLTAIPESLQLVFADPQPAAVRHGQLGVALLNYATIMDELPVLSRAIEELGQAVDDLPPTDPRRLIMASNLAAALRLRFERTERADDLDAAAEFGRQAAAAGSEDRQQRIAIWSNLGTVLLSRFEHRGRPEDLDEAITLLQRAAAILEPDDPSRTEVLSNLGIARRIRFELTGVAEDLDQAIEVGRAAVTAAGQTHPNRAACRGNLALALVDRFERVAARADLDSAIALLRSAEAESPGHPLRAGYLSNLNGLLRLRFERFDDPADLDAAIEAGRRAGTAAPPGHTARPSVLSELGMSLRLRFAAGQRSADLDEALTACREAAAGTPVDHPLRASRLSNLAATLATRFELAGQRPEIDEAVEAAATAVAVLAPEHPGWAQALLNLGQVLRTRAEALGSARDATAALAAFRDGAQAPSAAPVVAVRCGNLWAELAVRDGNWTQAVDAWRSVLARTPTLAARDLSRADRQRQLTLLSGIGPKAATAAIQTGDLEAAWTMLEQGRGVLISQALDTRSDPELARRHPGLAARVDQLRRDLNRDARPARAGQDPALVDSTERQRRARRQWTEVVALIRTKPGFERFAQPPTIDQFRQVPAGGVLVGLTVTGRHGNALILSADRLDRIPLPDLTEADLAQRVDTFQAAVHDPDATVDSAEVLRDVLGWLWEAVTGPVLAAVQPGGAGPPGAARHRVWWMPTGLLSLLPLHAAGQHGRSPAARGPAVLDQVISSYTPTARALLDAYRRGRPAGGQPLIVGVNEVPGYRPLSFAVDEATWVGQTLGGEAQPLLDGQATRDAVLAGLATASVAHFACHAQPVADPSDNHLVLPAGPLRVREVTTLDLPSAELAYLSACTTAFTGTRLVDEAIHMASAFQVAGFPHVIGTLWPIADRFAPKLTRKVYQELSGGAPPAVAVDRAVRALRDRYWEFPQVWASHLHFGP